MERARVGGSGGGRRAATPGPAIINSGRVAAAGSSAGSGTGSGASSVPAAVSTPAGASSPSRISDESCTAGGGGVASSSSSCPQPLSLSVRRTVSLQKHPAAALSGHSRMIECAMSTTHYTPLDQRIRGSEDANTHTRIECAIVICRGQRFANLSGRARTHPRRLKPQIGPSIQRPACYAALERP